MGTVWVSGVCDPYQPLEAKYRLTRKCLDLLVQNNWPVVIQTKSPLVLRDIDLFKQSNTIDVGLSIATANDAIRKVFEPQAPSVRERLSTVESLHQQGIRTYVMIAPILPEAEPLISILAGKVDYLIIDRMNYHYADKIYEQQGWKEKNTDDYFHRIRSTLVEDCVKRGVECRLAY
jgi:hypothetical protein